MGTYKSKAIKVDAEKLPILEEETEYEVKTRSPMPDVWKLNLLRGVREDEMKDEAMPIARRKCINKVRTFHKCEEEEGQYMTVFNCQMEYQDMAKCFETQLAIEMDRKRRDINRNDEWWWRVLYDENGEVGKQKEWKGEGFMHLLFKRTYNKYFSSGNNSQMSDEEQKMAQDLWNKNHNLKNQQQQNTQQSEINQKS